MAAQKKRCLYFSRFEPVAYGNGGCRRTVQLLEALDPLNPEFITSQQFKPSANPSFGEKVTNTCRYKFNMLSLFEKYVDSEGEYDLWHPDHRSMVCNLRRIAKDWARLTDKRADIGVALVDDPIYFAPLVRRLRERGIPIVAVCHNIESLCGGQGAEGKQRLLLGKELNVLDFCDLAITISREETVLLRNLGMRVVYFPYYPPDDISARLKRVRETRANTQKKDILMIGTVGNKPTKQGMLAVIRAWEKHDLFRTCGRLLVAGYGSDVLREGCSGPGIEFLGVLTDDELESALAHVRACLCYQEAAGGALCRITEMLIAGVPVVANSHAARSHYNRTGVVEFRNPAKIAEAVQAADCLQGKVAIPEHPDAFELLDVVKSIH